MQRVEHNNYDHHTKLKDIQKRFTLWTERLAEDVGMKPTDFKFKN